MVRSEILQHANTWSPPGAGAVAGGKRVERAQAYGARVPPGDACEAQGVARRQRLAPVRLPAAHDVRSHLPQGLFPR